VAGKNQIRACDGAAPTIVLRVLTHSESFPFAKMCMPDSRVRACA
jgi:hypothetical protein